MTRIIPLKTGPDPLKVLEYFLANKVERISDHKIDASEFRDAAFGWLKQNLVYDLRFNSTRDFCKYLESQGYAIQRKPGKKPMVIGLKLKE